MRCAVNGDVVGNDFLDERPNSCFNLHDRSFSTQESQLRGAGGDQSFIFFIFYAILNRVQQLVISSKLHKYHELVLRRWW